jgi:L-seryl-tRNA(Ser) seleniumtransferase
VAEALTADPDALLARAERIVAEVADAAPARAERSEAAVGGGGAPGVVLPSAAVVLPVSYTVALRTGEPAVVGHVERGRLLLDLVAVPPGSDALIVEAVRRAAKAAATPDPGREGDQPCT